MCKSHPYLSFISHSITIQDALPHGGIKALEVREKLESIRSKTFTTNPSYLSLFARELAYVMEYNIISNGNTLTLNKKKEDSRTIMELYLHNCGRSSLNLAVAFAERNTRHSKMLWDMLVSYCLGTSDNNNRSLDGSLFGELLIVSAQCGADLSSLVSQIPEGMQIDNLRHMLIGAVSDYKLKLKLHENASHVLTGDYVELLRELAHKSRKGLRVLTSKSEKTVKSKREVTPTVTMGGQKLLNVNERRRRLLTEKQPRLYSSYYIPIR